MSTPSLRSPWTRFAVVALCVAVASVAVGLTGGLRAYAATCPAFEFIGARGSGESAQTDATSPAYSPKNSYGMGDLLGGVYERLQKAAGGTDRVAAYGVHYPAVPVKDSVAGYINAAGAFLHITPLGAYTDSVRAGTQDVQSHIEARHAECPGLRFVLSGYSQGAQAVGDALQRMPQADRDLVVGAAFFGDPYFNARSWSSRAADSSHYGALGVRDEWPEALNGKIFSYCRPHDPICGISKRQHIFGTDLDVYYRDFPWFRNFDIHGQYASSKDNEDAARQLARVLGAPTPSSGTVPLDLVFAIDTTGSMGGVLADVRNNVTSLAQQIAATSSDYRFALVDYKDGGDQGDPYRARVDLPFTTDVTAFANAVDPLTADGGGDFPESVYSGVHTALDLPWRNGVRKIVMAIGDAPGKDPEPETGYTLDAIRDRALAVDPAQVYTVATSTDADATSFMTALADATGGKFSAAPSNADFVAILKDSIAAAGSAPVADVGGPYDGIAADPVVLSAGASRDEAENITAYDWDFDGDGTYDQTTTTPVVTHAYGTAGSYDVVLRARAASGLAGTATSKVAVAPAPALPTPPTDLKATAADGQVTLSWTRGAGGGVPTYYTITDGAGAVVDRVSAQPDGSAPPKGWADPGLTNGTAYSYKVSAGDAAGDSAPVGPVSATPGAATPPANRPPVATPDSFTTDDQAPLTVPAPGVLGNDSDPDAGDGVSATLATRPSHGSVTLQADGSFTYTPAPGYVGPDRFTYTATDTHGAASAPVPVDLTVTAVSTAQPRQRLVVAAAGRPPVLLAGRLTSGGVVVVRGPAGADSVTGTATVRDGGSTATVTFALTRTGRTWTGKITVKRGAAVARVFDVRGVVTQLGRTTMGGFDSVQGRIGFTIQDLPR